MITYPLITYSPAATNADYYQSKLWVALLGMCAEHPLSPLGKYPLLRLCYCRNSTLTPDCFPMHLLVASSFISMHIHLLNLPMNN